MQCEFCAETIQDAAVVCRFCGAENVEGRWQRAAAGPRRAPPGTFTLRFAGAAFLFSAVIELGGLIAPGPLFGTLRSAVPPVLYHGAYVALFAGLGVGLWRTRRWVLPLLLAATVFYTLDNLCFVLDEAGVAAQIQRQIGALGGLHGIVDEAALARTMQLAALLFVACWWGFYLYLRRRRDLLVA